MREVNNHKEIVEKLVRRFKNDRNLDFVFYDLVISLTEITQQ